MVFGIIITGLYNHYHHPILEHFYNCKKKPCTHQQSLLNLTGPRQTLIYFITIDLSVPDISYKWNYTICIVSYDGGFFYLYHACKIHSCCNMYQYFTPLYSIVWNLPHFIYLSSVHSFHFWVILLLWIFVLLFVWIHVLILLRYTQRNGNLANTYLTFWVQSS